MMHMRATNINWKANRVHFLMLWEMCVSLTFCKICSTFFAKLQKLFNWDLSLDYYMRAHVCCWQFDYSCSKILCLGQVFSSCLWKLPICHTKAMITWFPNKQASKQAREMFRFVTFPFLSRPWEMCGVYYVRINPNWQGQEVTSK